MCMIEEERWWARAHENKIKISWWEEVCYCKSLDFPYESGYSRRALRNYENTRMAKTSQLIKYIQHACSGKENKGKIRTSMVVQWRNAVADVEIGWKLIKMNRYDIYCAIEDSKKKGAVGDARIQTLCVWTDVFNRKSAGAKLIGATISIFNVVALTEVLFGRRISVECFGRLEHSVRTVERKWRLDTIKPTIHTFPRIRTSTCSPRCSMRAS